MFRAVSPQVSFSELDAAILEFWEREHVFERSVEARQGCPPFVFYEGPPTANGMPHPGHVLTRVVKDVFLRYRTMRGHHVPRHAGWDTHGLPVEVEVEKDLGITGRRAIEEYGVESFTRKCVDSVFRYIDEWRRMTRRIGFWVDLDRAYVTFHRSYVESVWWALATLFRKGLLYQDYKVVWWWPQGGTALSAGEVGQGYRTVDDPSVLVRFPLCDEPTTSLLAWTTTPWTLPSNVGLAVHPSETYVTVQLEDGERLVLAKALLRSVLKDRPGQIVDEYPGEVLCGRRYSPPFQYKVPENGRAHVVVPAEFVSIDTGSGLVHVAPAFGEDDFRVAKEHGLGFLQLVAPDGTFVSEVTDFVGRFCKEADRDIIRHLRQRGLLFSEETVRHEYPFSWRRDSDPLIQYARQSWFIRTTQEIDRVIANNHEVHWEPEHIQEGRFGSFLRTNVDWALSRERFWGTPLPIWVNDVTGSMDVVASVAEILERNPDAFEAFEAARVHDPSISDHLRVHKPWIDEVTWQRPGEPGTYRRVPEVIDCWFDSGCMPFAQWGYPHQGHSDFERNFPAHFITEAVDQTRGWFYSLMTISSLLFPERPFPHPFRNCVVLGLVSDDKGQKLSKQKKNYTDPMHMMERHGGDAVRWALYMGTVPGQNTRFFEGSIVDAVRDFLLKIWNVYSFFVSYANIDRWSPAQERPALAARSDLDRWILAEFDSTVRESRSDLDAYRSHAAARRLETFVDALSNWYVRRSRGRFWLEGDSEDKRAAFATLYEVLVDLSRLTAPFVPFLSEELYRNLSVPDGDASEVECSVHLADFPEPSDTRRDDSLRTAMETVRSVVSLGQRVRAESKIKIRQPLERALVVVTRPEDRDAVNRFSDAIREELNVHRVEQTATPERYVSYALVPNFRALGPKLGPRVPLCKEALKRADGSALYAALEREGHIALVLSDETVTLGPEDIEVRLEAKSGFAAASSHGHLVLLETEVSEELRLEGIAREVVNRIQRARKSMDLAYEQRIMVAYRAEGEVRAALDAHGSSVAEETLARSLAPVSEAAPEGAEHSATIEGTELTFWIQKAEAG